MPKQSLAPLSCSSSAPPFAAAEAAFEAPTHSTEHLALRRANTDVSFDIENNNDDDDNDQPEDETDTKARKRRRGPASVSDFIKKLFDAIDTNAFQSLIAWTPNGDSFVVYDQNEFAKEVLPLLFKHRNFQSFVRQLNKYDFHKVKLTEIGIQMYGDMSSEFKHPFFIRGEADLLVNITRKKVPVKRTDTNETDITPKLEDSVATGSSNSSNSTNTATLEAYNRRADAMIAQLQAKVQDLTLMHQDSHHQFTKVNDAYFKLHKEMTHLKSIVIWQDQMMAEFSKADSSAFAPQHKIQMLHMIRNPPSSGMPMIAPAAHPMQHFGDHNATPSMHAAHPNAMPLQVNTSSNMSDSPPLPGNFATPAMGFPSSASPNGESSPFSKHETLSGDMILDFLGAPSSSTPQGLVSPADLGIVSPHFMRPHSRSQVCQPSYAAPGPNNVATPAMQFPTAEAPGGRKPLANPSYRALVIEEQAVYRQILGTHFHQSNIECDYIASRGEFIRAYDDVEVPEKKYDIVFVDVYMLHLDGLRACAQVRNRDANARIVVLSAMPLSNLDMEAYQRVGVSQVLLKPFSPGGLKDVLARVGVVV
ncbi:kinase-regulated stress-responsive transcription factor skn7 [Podochytrium sp. JEL0797]|nr:kinase-regulated stress-responsive transcription factor skn7 [Podochytrium sp. JEL0797]